MVSVAIALKCLNGLKLPGYQKQSKAVNKRQARYNEFLAQNSTLKCSFGTSKYCLNFLKEASCESEACPFLHYVERRRDKVIHDDAEFKDFVNTQDRIVQNFMSVLELDSVRTKNDFYEGCDKDVMEELGLPSPEFIFD